MRRAMMQVYVKNSLEAVRLYERAFDAEIIEAVMAEDGTYFHSELSVYGQVLAVAEAVNPTKPPEGVDDNAKAFYRDSAHTTGNIMQFCLHFGEGGRDKVQKAYDVLKEGATILLPLGNVGWSSFMVDLIDRFGVRWCIFE